MAPVPRWLRRLLPALGHLAIAGVVSWPLLARDALPGHPDVDIWNHAWGPWWWADALGQGGLPWRTALLRWPDGGVLWFIDPALAALGAPLVGGLGVAGAVRAAIYASLAFSSWAGARLAAALGVTGPARFVASAALVCSAPVVCALHNGITESVHVGLVALALAWGEDAVRAPSRRAWAKAGLGVGLAAAASPYLGLGAGVALAARTLLAAAGTRRGRRAMIGLAALGAAVAVAVAAPTALAMRAQLHADDALVRHPAEMNDALALHNAVDPRTFAVPFGFRSVDLSAEGFEHSGYLGLVALALAALGGRGRGAWAAAGAASLLLALGPWLYGGDGWVQVGDARLPMPWLAVQALIPGLAVTHPLRLAVPGLAITAGLAAVGAARFTRFIPLFVALVALDGLVLSGAPWPLATAPADIPAVYADLVRAPTDPVDDAILDLPTDAGETMATSRYLYWQTAHHRPIPYAPDARASTAALLDDPLFRQLASLSSRRLDEQDRLRLDIVAPGSGGAERLRDRGVRWVVLHRDLDPAAAPALEEALRAALGPGEVVGEAVRWDLGRPARPPGRDAP